MEAVGGGGGMDDGNQSDDNLGSCGSVGDNDAHTPLDDDEGDDAESMSQSHSLSSPGGLSAFSSMTSPSMILPSPSTSLASPSVSLASPLTPLEYDCKPPQMPLSLPLSLPMYNPHSPLLGPPLNRQKVGTNPHDINNPLSVNQLTGKCIKTESGSAGSAAGGSASSSSNSNNTDSSSRAIRVT